MRSFYILLITLFAASNSCFAQLDTCDVDIHAVMDTPCSQRTLHLSVDSLPNTTYSWRGSGGWADTGARVTRDSILTIHTGKYIVTGIHGDCTYTDTVNVFIRATPAAPFVYSNNSPVCIGDTLKVLAGDIAIEPFTLYIDPFGNLITATSPDPRVLTLPDMQTSMAGTYSVYFIGMQGCLSDTTYFNVEVDSCALNIANLSEDHPFIPTLLRTQDAIFKPAFTTNPGDFHMLIFDATGRKVFKTNSPEGWDRSGYQGLYYYFITNKTKRYKGRVILL